MTILASYVSSSVFTVVGDRTTEFVEGRRLRMDCRQDGYVYSTVLSGVYASPNTTVYLDETNLTSNLYSVSYGVVSPGSIGSLPSHGHSISEGDGGYIAFSTASGGSSTLIGLSDTPDSYQDGYYLKSTSNGTEWASTSGSASTLLDLLDTPSSYSDGLYLRSTDVGAEWATVTGIPAHIHDDIYYTETELDNGQLDSRYYTKSEVDTISGSLQINIDGKADSAHTHDDRYYTESEIDTISGSLQNGIDGKADSVHTHDDRYYTETELNNGQLDSRYYTESEVDTISGSLQTNIDGKADTVHIHDDRYYTETEIDTLSGTLSNHGNLSGLDDDDHTQYVLATGARAFSGTISGIDPTASAHLATKNYVDNEILTISGALNSFLELSDTPDVYDVGKYLISTSNGTEWTDTLSGTSMYVDGDATITGSLAVREIKAPEINGSKVVFVDQTVPAIGTAKIQYPGEVVESVPYGFHVDNVEFNFVSSGTETNEVLRGSNYHETAINMTNAINATLTTVTGTVLSGAGPDYDTITVTATTAGVDGNAITFKSDYIISELVFDGEGVLGGTQRGTTAGNLDIYSTNNDWSLTTTSGSVFTKRYLAYDGSSDSPSYTFLTDGTTGVFRDYVFGCLGFSFEGSQVASMNSQGFILAVDGSASSPSFNFAGASKTDGDTGIYRITENTLGIATNGTLMLKIDTTGVNIPTDTFIASGDNIEGLLGYSSVVGNVALGTIGSKTIDIVDLVDGSSWNVMARFVPNAQAELYYNESKKLETTNTGAKITGDLEITTDLDVVNINSSGNMIATGTVSGTTLLGDGSGITGLNDTHIHDTRYYTETELDNGQLDSRYYTETEVDTISGSLQTNIDGKADTDHTHDDLTVTGTITANIITANDVSLGDNEYIRAGASNDIEIYCNGSGNVIQTNTGTIYIYDNTNSKNLMTAIPHASTSHVELYYNGSKKFETTNVGVSVTGGIVASANIANGPDDLIYSGSASTGYILWVNDSTLDAHMIATYPKTGPVYIPIKITKYDTATPDNSENMAVFNPDGSVELYYDNSKKLETTSSGVEITGDIDVDGGKVSAVTTSSGVPMSTPNKAGDFYVDTFNKKLYFSVGTSDSNDWIMAN